MAELDVANPAHVSSHQVLEADLGVGGRSLIVASGIARPEWSLDSDEVHRDSWTVHLRVPADRIEQVTTHVGLASIGNGDSGYGFSTDTADVVVNASTGELDLTVALALMGEPSSLNRFSYQVVATVVRTTSEVTGTITWPKTVFTPQTRLPSEVAPHFTAQLSSRATSTVQTPFGPDVVETLTPLLAGDITTVTESEHDMHARFRILNPPKGRELKVTVATDLVSPTPGYTLFIGAIAGVADVFTLSPGDPSRAGVDFGVTLEHVG
jgi:hypothetical protein